MRDYLEDFRKIIIYTVVVMIAFTIVLTIISLVITFYQTLFVEQNGLEDKQDFLIYIGNFLVVVIAVELLDTLVLYIKKHRLFPEMILMVVLAAVAREVLLTDLTHADPLLLIGVGVVIIAIAGAYYLIRRVALEAMDRGEAAGTVH